MEDPSIQGPLPPTLPKAVLRTYARARDILVGAKVPYGLGGGFAVGCYGHRRPTKDMDFFLPPEHAESALEALHARGFSVKQSDPNWLYQAWLGDARVDLIFRIHTSRGRYPVDLEMIKRGRPCSIGGESFHVLSPEDLIIMKILVQHENRADWWDALTILRNPHLQINWQGVLRYAPLDSVKFLSFLLFVLSLHPSESLIPRWVLEEAWTAAARELALSAPASPDRPASL